MKRVLLGMSGGVDSTYAAALLAKEGYEVWGACLKMHSFTEWKEAEDAAAALGIPFRVIDAQKPFETVVIRDFCDAYRNGRTPNPCVLCNETVKFRLLYEEAMRAGFDMIATGHYAKITFDGARYAIGKAADKAKDQSYMLYRLPQNILAKLCLPLGDVTKKEVFEKSKDMHLSAANRAESQEICFIQNESYTDYIERACGKMPTGEFVDEEGRVLGTHKGIIHYTLGQRKGLGISSSTRLFVKEISSSNHRIVLSSVPVGTERFALTDLVFSGLGVSEIKNAQGLTVKVRYSAKPVPVAMNTDESGQWILTLSEPAYAVTPGQSAVVYQGDRVACGGIIDFIQ